MQWETVAEYEWRQEQSSWDESVDPPRPLWRVYIKGSAGTVYADDIVWIMGRRDLLDDLYWMIVQVLDGHYHCCLSGKCWSLR